MKSRGALNTRGREDLHAADAAMDERVRCVFATEVPPEDRVCVVLLTITSGEGGRDRQTDRERDRSRETET